MTITKKHPAFFLAGSMIPPLGGVLILPFLWQKLTPADYGLLATAELIMAFGVAFIGLQQDSSLNRLYFEWGDNDKSRKISTLITIHLITSVLFGVIVVVLFEYLGKSILPKEAALHGNLILLFVIYLILAKQRGFLNAFLRVTGRSFEFLLYNLILIFVQIVFIIQYVFIEDLKLYGYILALLTTESFVVISALTYLYANAGFHFDLTTARSSVKFSVPLIPASIFSSISIIVERSILLVHVPLSDIGIFAVCQKVASVIQLTNNSLKMLFAPKAFEMVSNFENREVLSSYRNRYFIYILLFSAFILPLMTVLTKLSGSVEFRNAESLFPFFVLMGLLASMYPYFCSGAYFSKKTHLSAYPALVDLLVFSVLAILAGGVFLLNGIILAKLVGVFLFLVTGYIISQRVFYIPFALERKLIFAVILFVVFYFITTVISQSQYLS
jgi:O-antigen/teichoic acid export membrane protein